MPNFVICVALCGVLASVPSTAAADPVHVTSGRFAVDLEGDVLSFFAAGFALHHWPLSTGDDPNLGLFIPKVFDPAFCAVCDVGDTFNVSFRTPGEEYLGVGRATVNGTSYSDLTFRGTLDFRAESVVLPPGPLSPDAFFDASSPFTFSGFIRGFSGSSEVFVLSLFGNGRTVVPFFADLENRFHLEERGPLFSFEDTAPVPEPSTIMLVGLGAAALTRARRRQGEKR